MNYLQICQIQRHENNICYGQVTPKIYDKYNEISPGILFLEGLHQFAVKSVMKLFCLKNNADDSLRYVPVQLKNILIQSQGNYEDFYINGSVKSDKNLYKVEFKAFKNPHEMAENSNPISSGTLYVSSIFVNVRNK